MFWRIVGFLGGTTFLVGALDVAQQPDCDSRNTSTTGSVTVTVLQLGYFY